MLLAPFSCPVLVNAAKKSGEDYVPYECEWVRWRPVQLCWWSMAYARPWHSPSQRKSWYTRLLSTSSHCIRWMITFCIGSMNHAMWKGILCVEDLLIWAGLIVQKALHCMFHSLWLVRFYLRVSNLLPPWIRQKNSNKKKRQLRNWLIKDLSLRKTKSPMSFLTCREVSTQLVLASPLQLQPTTSFRQKRLQRRYYT